jgi:gluconate 5-dehydrogenase
MGAESSSGKIPPADAFRLHGQTAVITGGATGIGYGIARCFVRAGAQVVLVGRRQDALRHAVRQLGPAASAEAGDVARIEALPQLVERIQQRAGPIQILVNNAGIHLKKPAVETTEAELETVLRTHLVGAFGLTRLLAREMLESGFGSIIFISSMAATIGLPQVAAYAAAKSACTGIVRTLAAEFSPRGVRVNAIAPGWIETEMMRQAIDGDEERKRKILSRTPLRRFGVPEDIGWAAVYLSSPAASFTTGSVLPVDGGASTGF